MMQRSSLPVLVLAGLATVSTVAQPDPGAMPAENAQAMPAADSPPAAVAAAAEPTAADTRSIALLELLAAPALSCVFLQDPAAADTEQTDAGAFVHFEAIDVRSGTAMGGDRVIGGEPRIIPSSFGLHFYQFDERGELSLTTVTASRAADGRFLAVLSRHRDSEAGPVGDQIAGACTTASAPAEAMPDTRTADPAPATPAEADPDDLPAAPAAMPGKPAAPSAK